MTSQGQRLRCRVHASAHLELWDGVGFRDALSTSPGRSRRLDPSLFPGRWSARRAIPEEIAPLPGVCAEVLERAGWWQPGSGEIVPGGLVVAIDGVSLPAHRSFVRELVSDPAVLGPGAFLYALPSTSASVIGLLFGLQDYQATVTEGPNGGVAALGHGCDLLLLDRVGEARRALIAAISQQPGERRAAAAFCLEVVDDDVGRAGEETLVDLLTSAGSSYQMQASSNRLGVDPLMALAQVIGDLPPGMVVSFDSETPLQLAEKGC